MVEKDIKSAYSWIGKENFPWHIDFVTLWIVAHQHPLSLGFSRQEYWSGLPVPFPGDLPDLGIEPRSPTLRADSLPLNHLGSPYPAYAELGLDTQASSCLRKGTPLSSLIV